MFAIVPPPLRKRIGLTVTISITCLFLGAALRAEGQQPAAHDAARSHGFRVDNQVFLDGRNEPISRSTTIFHEGLAYDFMSTPAEVIVWDAPQGRFVLLDVAKRRQTELKTSELADFIQNVRKKAAESKEGRIRALADPKLEETYSASTGRLTLSNPMLTYAAVIKRPSAEASGQYREFSDWLAQLNTRLTPGASPLFARLALNKAIAERKAIATEVTLTTTGKGGQTRTFRSEHQYTEGLAQDDLARVNEAKRYIAEFTTVKFEDYRK